MSDIPTQDLAQLLQTSRGYEPYLPSDPPHQSPSPSTASVRDNMGLAIVLIPQDALKDEDGITVQFSAEGLAVHRRRRPTHTQLTCGICTPNPTLQRTIFDPAPAASPTAPPSLTPSKLRAPGSMWGIKDSPGSHRSKHVRRSRACSDASTASVPSSQILEMELVSPGRTVSKPEPVSRFNALTGEVFSGLESLGTQWETEPRVADDNDSETEPEAEPDDEWTALLMKRVFAHAAAEGALTSFKRKRR
ncbi:hypothetical protein PHLCEN_2v831 [Hermanssonia centrifuga]|uniref:Uncharacterized protein n=1 Tax=Hermanssonia centrifuga TaxID=98765 RepID=A0A2R6S4Y3_9APHY|nr:hypothetical protein PHLCEN_2v831 [Hermanssonia centrifuga]